MSVLVVTGTSTDVGKTVATAALAAVALAAGKSVAVCKPAQTGVALDEPGDLAEVVRLSGVANTVELVRYPDPLAPDTAARRSGIPMLEQSEVIDAVRELDEQFDVTIVEGAGGLLVRLGENGFTLLDVAAELAAPAVVVAAAGLGTLNHSELTVNALRDRGVECPGLIVGAWPAEPDLASQCNVDDLPAVTGVPVVGTIPEGAGRLAPEEFGTAAAGWIEKDWAAAIFG
ncbi:dethiobiotin synthase [Aldersonia kunmingensis]|uniref:dethiobiotin synthase n=1 Tax=Aldersonia kunmingensis TaxID=408066 RepID=UPI000831C3E9|nr:dethiobiotin synthase [Aldersonia kunmingensis]